MVAGAILFKRGVGRYAGYGMRRGSLIFVEEPKEVGVGWYLRTYLVSFAGILSLGFLLDSRVGRAIRSLRSGGMNAHLVTDPVRLAA